MTYEEWIERYKPIQNDIAECSPYGATMFETYGEELAHVKKTWEKTPNRIWTLLDEDGTTWISDGYHYVNRLGYFITEHDYAGSGIAIVLDEPDEEDEDES